MKNQLYFLLSLLLFSCHPTNNSPKELGLESIQTIPVNSSIRALEVIDDNTIWFAGSNGYFGYSQNAGASWQIDSLKTDSIIPHFRAIAHTDQAIFLLSIESPALLYKSTDTGKNWDIVYRENHPKAFYDAMVFWDNQEGIAMGDPTEDCLSVIITRDGGNSWKKLPCDILPKVEEGEAAFAASNSNIAVYGQHAWIVSGGKKARVFHSADRGRSWAVFDTPIVQGAQMTGIFSVAFKDDKNGIVFGGDWEKQALNRQNKAITSDGGKTWQLMAGNDSPGYRSCARYLPDSKSNEILAVGMPGISYSPDGGQQWKSLSDESFYTVRFGSKKEIAWVAGNKKIGQLQLALIETISTQKIPSPTSTKTTLNTNGILNNDFQEILSKNKLIGSILIYDYNEDIYHSNDFNRAKKGFIPASTFKVPNSIVALETGVVKDQNTIIKWNGQQHWQDAWEKDMTFQEAIKVSCVPCYQEIARKVGPKKMRQQLKKMGYPDMIFDESTIDQFWLTGKSKITQFQQIDFLGKLFNKQLPITERNTNIMKKMLFLHKHPNYKLSGKTGWAVIGEQNIGWFVAHAETADNQFLIATNVEPGEGFEMKNFPKVRASVSKEALDLLLEN